MHFVVWIGTLLFEEEVLKRRHVNARCMPFHHSFRLIGEKEPVNFVALLLEVRVILADNYSLRYLNPFEPLRFYLHIIARLFPKQVDERSVIIHFINIV